MIITEGDSVDPDRNPMTFSGLVLSGANNSLQNYYLPEYAEDGFLT